MAIRERMAVPEGIGGFEYATIVGILLTMWGSTSSWIEVTVEPGAAEELDDFEAGTAVKTGTEVNFGEITLYLAVFAALVLALVLWRYRAAGRKTGVLLTLIGLATASVALVGIVLTGLLFSQAGIMHEGVTVSLGTGIFVTLLGAVVILTGGLLRLAAGPPELEEASDPEGGEETE